MFGMRRVPQPIRPRRTNEFSHLMNNNRVGFGEFEQIRSLPAGQLPHKADCATFDESRPLSQPSKRLLRNQHAKLNHPQGELEMSRDPPDEGRSEETENVRGWPHGQCM